MQKTILVLGGTGMLGAPAARQLQTDGFAVHLLARNPEKTRAMFGDSFKIIQGDVTDLPSLEQALEGCEAVHISVGGAVDQLSAENIARIAPRLGIQRISYVSGSTVAVQNSWFPMVYQKLMAEKAIRECGVPYMIFCPTWPMEQLPRFVRGSQASVIGKQAAPLHWFAAEDLASMVSKAHQCESAANKRFYIHGPEAITMKQALERYCRAFHPDIQHVSTLPISVAKALAVLTRNHMLKFATGLMAYFDKVGELGDPKEANRILGAPKTTLDTWIARRAASAA